MLHISIKSYVNREKEVEPHFFSNWIKKKVEHYRALRATRSISCFLFIAFELGLFVPAKIS